MHARLFACMFATVRRAQRSFILPLVRHTSPVGCVPATLALSGCNMGGEKGGAGEGHRRSGRISNIVEAGVQHVSNDAIELR
jgi:hypothetical protein